MKVEDMPSESSIKEKVASEKDMVLEELVIGKGTSGDDEGGDNELEKQDPSEDELLALEELVTGEDQGPGGDEETDAGKSTEADELAALEELVGAEPVSSDKNGDEANASEEKSADAGLQALEELVAGEQEGGRAENDTDSATASETKEPDTEELAALEELVGAEQADVAQGTGDRKASEQGGEAEELQALEELVAAGAEGVSGSLSDEAGVTDKPESTPLIDQKEVLTEDSALDELVSVSASGGEMPPRKDQGPEKDSEGIITLKEVVALGEAVEKGASESRKKARKAPAGPRSRGSSIQKALRKAAVSPEAGGVSREEQEDLDRLIKGFNEGQLPAADVVSDLQNHIVTLQKRIVQLTKMVAQMDGKMKTFGDVLRLYNKKTDLINERIDQVVSASDDE